MNTKNNLEIIQIPQDCHWAISDKDGNFSLNVNSAPPLTLVFSIVGYESQELEINDSASDVSINML